MTAAQEQPSEGLPTFFAPHAFSLGRLAGVEIHHDVDKLQAVTNMSMTEFGPRYGIGTLVESAVMVYRYGSPGFGQRDPDISIHDRHTETRYHPASALALSPAEDAPHVAKADVIAAGHPVQVDVNEEAFRRPLIWAFTKSLLYPPAEASRVKAGGFAWLRQVGEALNPVVSEGKKNKLLAEVVSKYAGAIVLKPRPS